MMTKESKEEYIVYGDSIGVEEWLRSPSDGIPKFVPNRPKDK